MKHFLVFSLFLSSCAGSWLSAKRRCEAMERPPGLSLEECIEDAQETVGSMCLEDHSEYNSYIQCLAANDDNPNFRACSGTLPDMKKFRTCVDNPIKYRCERETAANGGSVYECQRLYEQRASLARQERKLQQIQEDQRRNDIQNAVNALNQINTNNRLNHVESQSAQPQNYGIPMRSGSSSVPVQGPSR